MYRAHRAVIFTIAQLSYFQNGNDHISKHAVLFSYSKPVAFKTAVTLAAPGDRIVASLPHYARVINIS